MNKDQMVFRRGDPGFAETNAMAERMWKAIAHHDEAVHIGMVINAVILLIVTLMEAHIDAEKWEAAIDAIAASAKESLKLKPASGKTVQ